MGRETLYVCDKCCCKIDTDEEWVNAMVYGATFHLPCWELIGGPHVARLLYLDDIDVYVGEKSVRRAMQPNY